MSNYTVTTNFANKDSLPSGSSDKIIKGSEFSTEFNNIATAVNSKVDSSRVLTDVPSGAVFTDTVYTKPTSEPISYITGLQTALDGKVSTSDTDFVKLTNVSVSATEINYLSGVTSSIQTQIDNIGGSPWTVGSGFISIYNDAIHGGVFVYDNGNAGGAHYINIDHDASLPNAYYKHFTYQGTTVGSITRSGTTGVSYTFTSAYSPVTATLPITYVWSPIPALGQGTNTGTYTWTAGETYVISITVSNAASKSITDTHQISIEYSDFLYLPVIIRDP